MLLLGRQPETLTEADLQTLLVSVGVGEGDRLGYKRDIYAGDDESRRELLRDVTAMANHRGGHILIGVEEDQDGVARAMPGVTAGQHATWIRSLCLTAVEPRIVGLEVHDQLSLGNGMIVVIIDVPESRNAPHMVTFKGLNQFWRRHGREKQKMTVNEIRDAMNRALETQGRIERYWAARDRELEREFARTSAGPRCWMVVSLLPLPFDDGAEILNVHNRALREMVDHPTNAATRFSGGMWCGRSLPTLHGIRADDADHERPKFLEVHRNGYAAFGMAIAPGHGGSLSPAFRSLVDTEYIVNFVAFASAAYGQLLGATPALARLSFVNAAGLGLMTNALNLSMRPLRFWQGDQLDLGTFAVDDLTRDAQTLPKRICDRLWNAFGREAADVFDAAGVFNPPAD